MPMTYVLIPLVIALIIGKKHRIWRNTFFVIAAVIFLLFSNKRLEYMAEDAWASPYSNVIPKGKTYQYGIVLGGYSYWDWQRNRPEFGEAADRLTEGVQLYHKGIIKKLVLASDGTIIQTGGKGMQQGNPAEMKKYMLRLGIKEEDLIFEKKAVNTWQNATFTLELIGDTLKKQKPLIITSAQHMRRSVLAFKLAGVDVDAYATDNIVNTKGVPFIALPSFHALCLWRSLLHEILGYYSYQLIYRK